MWPVLRRQEKKDNEKAREHSAEVRRSVSLADDKRASVAANASLSAPPPIVLIQQPERCKSQNTHPILPALKHHNENNQE